MKAVKRNQEILSDRFEIAFNQIHKCLIDELGGKGEDRFKFLLDIGSSKHSLVRSFYDELCQFAKLRNAIVHEKTDHGYYIAEPHLDIVERAEQIAAYFMKPEHALSIATKAVMIFEENDTLRRVLECIKKHDYTRFPIYNTKGEYQWLLTASDILNWMTKQLNDNVINLDDARIKDLKIKNKKQKQVEFISKSSSIFKAEEIFEKYHNDNKKLEAIIVTLNGKSDEKPLGIITSYNLIEIEY
ncbi:CBS domain-containing protein [Fictibacillus aquaticus]|uniref:CBS domain-containing protein n=1 Tax=Fictibacillus aquaticus TaxID=2021314 RepID=A0A235FBS0_9BACL|nr:CBS domain-containing protein [Fictibacillus aquaticus]OYD58639.1 hypothetical protein CGZ90_01685 [Fictibacillus aquaticus]